MTKAEENLLIGEVASDLAALRKRIGCLETKVEKYQRALSSALKALRNDGEDVFPDESEWPGISDMERLRGELNDARSQQWNLTKRLREWGVID